MKSITIREDVFLAFFATFTNEIVGKATDLRAEVMEALLYCADYALRLNKVKAVLDGTTFWAVECDEEYLEKSREKLQRSIVRATRKILWLNSVCNSRTGECFVEGKVDRTNLTECAELIEKFYMLPISRDGLSEKSESLL